MTTEKRYVLHETKDFGNLIEDTKDGRCLPFMRNATEELNHLHEENQSLKVQLDECTNNKLYSRRQLEKENETLKKHIENTLDNAIKNERTELGRSVLKQFKESI